MHDPVEIRRRIDRLLALLSRRDDYGELLANGHVVGQVKDADAWRAANPRPRMGGPHRGTDRC
ncbi:MAG: hypothetical protein QOI98_1468 [Solirubrobacteraceae bacterium]|nr:hypothetical protein [Solirubrobacteraceae bacterium]